MAKKKGQEEENVEEEEDADADKGDSSEESDSSSDGKFEQDDIDRVAGKSRKEGHTAGHNSALETFGFESEEEGIKFLKEARKIEDAKKSELEKLTGTVDGLVKAKEDAETALEAEKSSSLTTRLKSAVMLEIVSNTELKIHPKALDDIWSALTGEYLGDDGIHIDENGKIKGVADSVKKLLKAKPYFTSTSDDETHSSDTRRKKDTVGKGERIEDEHNPKYGKFTPNPRL